VPWFVIVPIEHARINIARVDVSRVYTIARVDFRRLDVALAFGTFFNHAAATTTATTTTATPRVTLLVFIAARLVAAIVNYFRVDRRLIVIRCGGITPVACRSFAKPAENVVVRVVTIGFRFSKLLASRFVTARCFVRRQFFEKRPGFRRDFILGIRR
jgi:hypothetical protein